MAQSVDLIPFLYRCFYFAYTFTCLPTLIQLGDINSILEQRIDVNPASCKRTSAWLGVVRSPPSAAAAAAVVKMSSSKFRQDMPPSGGYKPIQYLRIPAKTYFSGKTMFAGWIVIQLGAMYLYKLNDWMCERWIVEERSTRLGLLPMLLAEKDRLYLKRLRQIRDEERELMKDVKGWVVGTYWGEPIYKSRPEGTWHDVTLNEYYAQNSNWDQRYAYNFHKWF